MNKENSIPKSRLQRCSGTQESQREAEEGLARSAWLLQCRGSCFWPLVGGANVDPQNQNFVLWYMKYQLALDPELVSASLGIRRGENGRD